MKQIMVETALGTLACWEDTVGNALRSGQFWDQQIQAALDDADPLGWAIDIGANIGWFTLYLAQRHAGVIAVEAHPETFALLLANVMGSGRSHVTCLPYAAYDAAVPLTLASPIEVGWEWDGSHTLRSCPHPASIVYRPAQAGERSCAMGVPLDSILRAVYHVSLIKVDAQGCDLNALRGLRQTIARCRPIIVFEYEESPSAWNGCTWEDYLDFFAGLHYDVTRIREDLWDYVARPR